jgi:hypothetical protein
VKKKLAIDPVEAELVRTMFKLFLEGIDVSGSLGVKKSWNGSTRTAIARALVRDGAWDALTPCCPIRSMEGGCGSIGSTPRQD